MFWSSVLGGLKILLHWQVWVALIIYGIATGAWLIGIGLLFGREESGGRMALGCLTHMIGGMVFQAVLLSVMIFFLAPIMLGGDKVIPIKYMIEFFWPIAKSGLIAMAIVFIIACIPIIGGLISNTPGLADFISGIIIFRIFSATFIEIFLEKSKISANIYPGFWYSVFYFLIALAISYGGLLIITSIKMVVSRNNYDDDVFMIALAPVIVKLFSLLPLFMYAQYTSQTIKKLIN